jgi:hypothetical protein
MRRYLIVGLLFSSPILSFAQLDSTIHNVGYVEVFGNSGGLLSINYARIFRVSKNNTVWMACRAGFSIINKSVDSSSIYNFPLEMSGFIGRGKHHLEIGAGYTPGFGTSNLKSPGLPPNDRINRFYAYLFRCGYLLTMSDDFILRISPVLELMHNDPTTKRLYAQVIPAISIGMVF